MKTPGAFPLEEVLKQLYTIFLRLVYIRPEILVSVITAQNASERIAKELVKSARKVLQDALKQRSEGRLTKDDFEVIVKDVYRNNINRAENIITNKKDPISKKSIIFKASFKR